MNVVAINSPDVQNLSTLLNLQSRARQAGSETELGFIMVNETHGLTPYRQAILWATPGNIIAVSGVSAPEKGVPFTQWLKRVCQRLDQSMSEADKVEPQLLCETDSDEWSEWLPPEALWLPLTTPDGTRLGALLMARDEAWQQGDLLILKELAQAYAHAWALLRKPSPMKAVARGLARPLFWIFLLAALGVAGLLIPVRLSVLAPAEIVASNPAVVRAPLEGVVERFHVRPNDRVVEGQPLFDLNPAIFEAKLDVARRELATITTQSRQVTQQAIFNPKVKSKIAILSNRVKEKKSKVSYLIDLLERSRVKAMQSGVVVMDDPTEWIGRPVRIGERVMTIADEHETEIEAWLPIGDAIELDPQAAVTVFLNVDPLNPVEATLRYAAYEAIVRPDGKPSYRIRATLTEGAERPRLGLKGTARIDGKEVSLAYWVFRRPLSALRQFAGL